MAWSDWASVAVTGGLGLAGLYFANSLKRRARQDLDREVAEKRFAAYGAMWTHMIQASPMAAGELGEAAHSGSWRTSATRRTPRGTSTAHSSSIT